MRNSLWFRLGATVVLASLTAASISLPVNAAPPVAPAVNPQDPLGLTAAQQAQIATYRTDAQTKFTAIQSNKSLTPAQKAAKLKDLQAWFVAHTTGVLTPTQKAKLAAERKVEQARQAVVASKIAQYRALGAKLKATFSAKQQTDLAALTKAQNGQLQALVANKALTDDQKRTQFKAMQASNEAKFNAILTPAQLSVIGQLNAMRSQIQQMMGPPPGQGQPMPQQ